jgi:thiamine biosynthesis lipoprotein
MASPCCFHLPAGTSTDVITAMEAEVRRIEAKYSRYRDDSVLSLINENAGQTVALDNETLWLINYACACFEQSEGLFDISSGVLRQAWDFRAGVLPSESVLAQLLARVGFDRIELSGGHLTMLPDMELDLGGIGKEYAVDAAATIARQAGIKCGVVDLGGDLCVLGPHEDGSPWQLGVRNPRDTESAIASLPVYQGGMASSGDYERFFEIDGKRYCHLLNARTGFPVEYWASVTVIAPSCLLAGTLSSIAMLKQESGEDWLRSQEVNALLIRPDLSLLSLTDR